MQKDRSVQPGDELLEKEKIRALMHSHLIKNILVLNKTDSTNLEAKRLAAKSEINQLIVAETQSAGKGSRGRSFISPLAGIYMTILLFPDMPIKEAQYFTIISAIAVCETLEEFFPLKAEIKWLNDVYVAGKKICGILCEGQLEGEDYKHIALGIGINYKNIKAPKELIDKVQSIENLTELTKSRNQIIAKVVDRFSFYYDMVLAGDFSFMDIYRARNFLIGETICLADETIYHVKSINDLGHLIVESGGKTLELHSGEVSLHGFRKND